MAADEVAAFLVGYQREVNQGRSLRSAERQQVERALAAIERRLDGLYDAIAEGLRSPGLKEKLETLEARRDVLRGTLAKPAPSPVRLHAGLAEHYRRKMEGLAAALQGPGRP